MFLKKKYKHERASVCCAIFKKEKRVDHENRVELEYLNISRLFLSLFADYCSLKFITGNEHVIQADANVILALSYFPHFLGNCFFVARKVCP